MEKLNAIRDKIDECDQIIIKAFEERMRAVIEILDYKRQQGLAIYDDKREVEVLAKALENLSSQQFEDEAKQLMMEIIKISRRMQSKILTPHNIVLIGFMGTGKTTVGKGLAKKLEMDFVDLDQLIEGKIGTPIAEYFQNKGEAAFREVEKTVVEKVSTKSNTVISCGGGVVLKEENIINLRTNGKLVLLSATEDTIYNRIKDDQTRPLLKGNMGIERIREILQQRNGLYHNAADIIVCTENKSPDDVCHEIIRKTTNLQRNY